MLLKHCIVRVQNPKGQIYNIPLSKKDEFESQEIMSTQNKKHYKVKFQKPTNGEHLVGVVYKGFLIEESLETIDIEIEPLNLEQIKVLVKNPENVQFESYHEFQIQTNNIKKKLTFEGHLIIPKSSKHISIPIKFSKIEDNLYIGRFLANSLYAKAMEIMCENKKLIGSPFPLNVLQPLESMLVCPYLETQNNFTLNKDYRFNVYLSINSGEADLVVEFTDPDGKTGQIDLKKSPQLNVNENIGYVAIYHPIKEGTHVINATLGGFHIQNSPLTISVKPDLIPMIPATSNYNSYNSNFNSTSNYNSTSTSNLSVDDFNLDLDPDKQCILTI